MVTVSLLAAKEEERVRSKLEKFRCRLPYFFSSL
jgi:hypothetical protein